MLLAVIIKIFSLSSNWVEHYYSTGVYPWIAYVQRLMFGWIPISIGDLLYAYAGLWLIVGAVRLIKAIRRRQVNGAYLKKGGLRLIQICLVVYVLFNLFWGLNYNRYGIDYQLKLETSDYNDSDLVNVTRELGAKLNLMQPGSVVHRNQLSKKRVLFDGAIRSYAQLSAGNQIFSYRRPSVKPSLYSYLGNILGFTGYYNPFTGEAQVNTTVPLFIRPFTTCHEIGHSLGYAKESEANFAGYLSATHSADTAFLYSVYFDMYAYAGRYLYYSDSMALKEIDGELSPGVRRDIRELRAFLRKYDNPIETAIDRLYSQYLRANEQPSGKLSYNEVIGMLIAYYKRHGSV